MACFIYLQKQKPAIKRYNDTRIARSATNLAPQNKMRSGGGGGCGGGTTNITTENRAIARPSKLLEFYGALLPPTHIVFRYS